MIDLSGKVALITGASRGIGRACAERLAACGADVVVNCRSSTEAAADVVRTVQSFGSTGVAVKADVSERDDIVALMEFIEDRFGQLDILVSNAAAGGFRPLMDLSPANWDAVLRANSAPLVWLTQAGRHLLQKAASPSRVIAISSHGSQWAVPNYGVIGASKAALESLVRHLAFELGPSGINFNTVLPGIVQTEAIRTMPGADAVLNAAGERMLVKADRITPDDVANVVAFLASSLSDLIQGQTIVVDGGVSVRI
ncbi:MAG: SDR family oxidoreductase [Planctomycetaceae bacterium]